MQKASLKSKKMRAVCHSAYRWASKASLLATMPTSWKLWLAKKARSTCPSRLISKRCGTGRTTKLVIISSSRGCRRDVQMEDLSFKIKKSCEGTSNHYSCSNNNNLCNSTLYSPRLSICTIISRLGTDKDYRPISLTKWRMKCRWTESTSSNR